MSSDNHTVCEDCRSGKSGEELVEELEEEIDSIDEVVTSKVVSPDSRRWKKIELETGDKRRFTVVMSSFGESRF